jgi:hypothetical protein
MDDREGKMGRIQRRLGRKLQKPDNGLRERLDAWQDFKLRDAIITFSRLAEAVASPLEISARTAMDE